MAYGVTTLRHFKKDDERVNESQHESCESNEGRMERATKEQSQKGTSGKRSSWS